MQSYAEYLNELGEARGRAEGEARGRVEGEIAGERRVVLRQGTSLFGPPDAATLAKLEAIQSLEVLELVGLRVLMATSWEEVLGNL